MSIKLKKLLAAYEAERTSLTAEMEECVAEMDYGKAHLFFKALARINQQLQTLNSLQDERHDEKEDLMHSVKFLEELVDAEDYMRDYHKELLAEAKEKLAELNRFSTQKAPAEHVVRGIMVKLLAGEMSGFTLIFEASQRLSCHIKLVRKTLILTVPEIRRHRASSTLEKRHIRNFKRIGFRLYDNKDKLMLFAPYSTLAELAAVQCVLARVTFEVFYFKELAGETYIKYHP
ncbi:hypothetical protein ACFQ48_10390 [Hymenobacter caeli]|uniref:RNA-binding protein with EMAP domain n=1 Tax=Hymenobacter caeli TaxID=2735894 RepID=A0ABX2FS23_9BACT|nr:hypothetical protein [Hymenobacter caeli]NRT19747.1 putative RNA-binding protein with EMAP domain [Hymenobacter caeli]